MDALTKKRNKQPDQDDEIDLIHLTINLINAFQRNLKIFFIIVFLGALTGVLYYYGTKPVFETSLVASSKVLTNLRVENLVSVLDKLAKEHNYAILAKRLHLSPQLAAVIKGIKAESIIDPEEKRVENKTMELDNNVFEITLFAFSNQEIDSLQDGILYYLQKNSYVEKRTAIEKQNLEAMRERVIDEVKKLDSLRFYVNKLISKGSDGNSTMLLSDPSSVNKDIITLYEKELEIKSDLQLIDDVQVIQDFTPYAVPTSPILVKSVAASTGSAITLALIIITILEIQRGMRKLKQKLEQKIIKEKEFV